MFLIKDTTIKKLILEHLVERIERGDQELDELLRAGLEPALLDQLRRREARDFIHVAHMHQLELFVQFDNAAVAAAFQRLDSLRHDRSLCEYFVLHGASDGMIQELFKLAREDSRRLRRLLTPGATPPGPPKLPPPEARQRIHDDWAVIQRKEPCLPVREALHRLHQVHSQTSLQALWVTLKEFEMAPAMRVDVR